MTNEQFELYLQSIGGLLNGYFPDRDPAVSRYFFSVGNGWLQLIHDLIEELIANGWDKKICQVKTKYGSLRFYPTAMSEVCWNILNKYEQLSQVTCELCGKPATEIVDHG